ncbi:HEPN domain-containing protein [Leptospira stimsonii]|uniref:Uncharacterized protein n=1 Tax=Leptospira stimsonii TaxID=2202203 RepID=A0A396YL61_9LEPT|nr:HEPN domain-containing protein [Leptospira stimsonii]RHX83922.1 hypothetical protein DLM75_23555 [Leptospira stimsonii]
MEIRDRIADNITKLLDLNESENGRYFSINNSESILLKQNILKQLVSIKIAGKNTSKTTIEKKLNSFLLEYKFAENPDSPLAFIENLIQFDNQDFVNTEVLLPFSGGALTSKMDMADFSIDYYTPELRMKILETTKKVVEANTKFNEKEKNKNYLDFNKYLLKEGNFLVLRYSAKKDPELVAEEAQNRLEILLRFLNFAALLTKDRKEGVVLLPGTSQINIRSGQIDISEINVRFSFSFFGVATLNINEIMKNDAYSGIFKYLIAQISNSNLHYPASVIVNSILWASNANITFSLEAKVLNLIIAMESLVPHQKNVPISGNFAESIAFILGSNYSEKRKYYDYLKSIYNKRSQLAHGSNHQITDDDLNQIRNFYTRMLNYLIVNSPSLKGDQDLIEKILNAKFGNN